MAHSSSLQNTYSCSLFCSHKVGWGLARSVGRALHKPCSWLTAWLGHGVLFEVGRMPTSWDFPDGRCHELVPQEACGLRSHGR
jgi:hypothetical protein